MFRFICFLIIFTQTSFTLAQTQRFYCKHIQLSGGDAIYLEKTSTSSGIERIKLEPGQSYVISSEDICVFSKESQSVIFKVNNKEIKISPKNPRVASPKLKSPFYKLITYLAPLFQFKAGEKKFIKKSEMPAFVRAHGPALAPNKFLIMDRGIYSLAPGEFNFAEDDYFYIVYYHKGQRIFKKLTGSNQSFTITPNLFEVKGDFVSPDSLERITFGAYQNGQKVFGSGIMFHPVFGATEDVREAIAYYIKEKDKPCKTILNFLYLFYEARMDQINLRRWLKEEFDHDLVCE